MKYKEALDYVNSFIPKIRGKWNKNFGLSKILFLLNKIGNPHIGMKYVHIGGTAGKGSTATLVASILKESGYKTGLHVSPHTISIRERAQINGINIPKKRFSELVEYLEPVIESMKGEFGEYPSYYEILLVLTFLYFKQEQTDINVIEVGIGGKLDGTNVIDCYYQIITNVGLDHTAILGPTKEDILKDKREIIKKNSIVVSGITESELKPLVKEKAEQTNSQTYFLNEDFYIENISLTNSSSYFEYKDNQVCIKDLEINLLGDFQVKNASLAIKISLEMRKEFPDITIETIRPGLKNAYIPGRLQVVSQDPLTIFDGAHNPDKIKALVFSLKSIYPNKKFITVFRYKKRDDIIDMLKKLKEISEKIIITGSKVPSDMGLEETYDESDINEVRKHLDIDAVLDSYEALLLAKQYQKEIPEVGILATGSIFMVRELISTKMY